MVDSDILNVSQSLSKRKTTDEFIQFCLLKQRNPVYDKINDLLKGDKSN